MPPEWTHSMTLAILSLAPALVDILLVGSFMLDMLTMDDGQRQVLRIWCLRSLSFNKLIFHFEIAATFSLSPLLFSLDLHNLLECSSYSQVPFCPEKMTAYSEEQAKINSYFCCKFPHCQRYFSTEFGLKIHQNHLHPDWNSDEGWLVILLLEICPHNNSRSPPTPLHNVF
jgi:hypothetical protein